MSGKRWSFKKNQKKFFRTKCFPLFKLNPVLTTQVKFFRSLPEKLSFWMTFCKDIVKNILLDMYKLVLWKPPQKFYRSKSEFKLFKLVRIFLIFRKSCLSQNAFLRIRWNQFRDQQSFFCSTFWENFWKFLDAFKINSLKKLLWTRRNQFWEQQFCLNLHVLS